MIREPTHFQRFRHPRMKTDPNPKMVDATPPTMMDRALERIETLLQAMGEGGGGHHR